MSPKEIIIVIIALIVAGFIFQLLLGITMLLIKTIAFMIVAYAVYLFLKRIL
ncbi:MAG: hypothetical protein OIN89_03255 [Candidatus Methanoperedens sp.]|jgi:4-hydroxybenzoate polyprenyltransferase|nr:hypothetical protein [Candidatus Methanoperedens sp.]